MNSLSKISFRFILVISICSMLFACATKRVGSSLSSAQRALPSVSVSPEVKKSMSKGLTLLDQKQYGKAEEVFKKLAAENPRLTSPLLNLSLIYYRQLRYLEAESTLREALRRNSYRPEIYNLLGVVLRQQGRFQEAESAYKYALQIDDDYAKAHMNIAVLYDLYLLDKESAKRHYRRYAELVPKEEKQVNAWMLDMQQRAQVSN